MLQAALAMNFEVPMVISSYHVQQREAVITPKT